MPRSYHVDIARHAAGADAKWVDNLLSHFPIPGVEGGRQGCPRRISDDGIIRIALIRELTFELGMPLARAVRMAEQLLTADDATATVGDHIAIRFERGSFKRRIDALIADAVESVMPVPRGRPRSAGGHP